MQDFTIKGGLVLLVKGNTIFLHFLVLELVHRLEALE